jgi:hypothetical protein
MRPAITSNVHFPHFGAVDDFLLSNETTAVAVRQELIERLKRGEGLVAVPADGSPSRALVLKSATNPSLKGKPEGDELIALPFA